MQEHVRGNPKGHDLDLLGYTRQIGLDVERFERDFASPNVVDAIQRSLQEGARSLAALS